MGYTRKVADEAILQKQQDNVFVVRAMELKGHRCSVD